jgi:hypothetical protein
MTATGCICTHGWVNQDNSWATGCEVIDPACTVTSCGNCPAPDAYCGANAHCRDNAKCRCIDGNWLNSDGNWGNGCETYTTTCTPTNCNDCYVGYCGPHANCMQSNCECTESGWSNCDGSWELSGCECNGTCSGGQCQ